MQEAAAINVNMAEPEDVTQLLRKWSSGDGSAEAALSPMVYAELHRQAQRLLRGERAGHTLQPTALVHEAYLRLADAEVDWSGRVHFFALSARMMRRLLVNHANARAAGKRGGGVLRVTLSDAIDEGEASDAALLELADALESLEKVDPQKAQLIELQYFGGLTVSEIEEVTGLSSATIGRHLRFARAWIRDCMASEAG